MSSPPHARKAPPRSTPFSLVAALKLRTVEKIYDKFFTLQQPDGRTRPFTCLFDVFGFGPPSLSFLAFIQYIKVLIMDEHRTDGVLELGLLSI
ncbi:hypothetical protein V6N12_022140 [Hibiscus sabdariffa]|uniref:Uncharacterized protein n=1 Tax=Hibiscus sabdariffa TaxID=183260 RepID=A0ABR2FTW8_9ROSI